MSVDGASINKRSCGMEVDRISNLPLDVIHKIIECLPIKEAIKTSVLSQHWRFKWASIPQLVLDVSFCDNIIKGGHADISSAYSNAVNSILLGHVESISKFVLYVPSWFPGETWKWIRFVFANDIKELILVFHPVLQVNLPTCMFTCSGLTHLTVNRCKLLSLPPTFKGFPCLIKLQLCCCSATESCFETEVLETLISSCPLLENLHLTIDEEANLKIHAPKLKNLIMQGYLDSLCIEGTMAINTVNLNIDLVSCWNEILNSFANVENLVLGWLFWQTVERYDCLKKFPEELGQLQTLNLVEMELYNQFHVSFALLMFASSPQLKQISIEAKDDEDDIFDSSGQIDSSDQIDSSCILQCLTKLQLRGISGLSGELPLLKYILAHSHVLEDITIELSAKMCLQKRYDFAVEAMQYRRVSPNAVITIMTK